MKRINSIGVSVVLFAALAVSAAPAMAHGHHGKRGHKARHHVVLRKSNHRLSISDAGTSADRIGTIVSFNATDGTLAIKLDGGKTIEGTVNDGTEIKCVPAPTAAPTTARSADHGDDGESGDDHGGDSSDDSDDSGDSGSGDYPGGSGHHGHCDHSADTPCTTADLVEGAVVREAELSLTSDGLVFDEIKLAK